MIQYRRAIKQRIKSQWKKDVDQRGVVIYGPRQAGKTTLANE